MAATCRNQFVNEMLQRIHPLTVVDSAHLLIFFCTTYSAPACRRNETRYAVTLPTLLAVIEIHQIIFKPFKK
jgi:hypothetical protein